MKELSEQLNDKKFQIIMAVGLLRNICRFDTRCKNVLTRSKSNWNKCFEKFGCNNPKNKRNNNKSAEILKQKIYLDEIQVESYDQYFAEYGLITKEGKNAILECANLEGFCLIRFTREK